MLFKNCSRPGAINRRHARSTIPENVSRTANREMTDCGVPGRFSMTPGYESPLGPEEMFYTGGFFAVLTLILFASGLGCSRLEETNAPAAAAAPTPFAASYFDALSTGCRDAG